MGPALPALKDPLTGAPSPRHLRSQSPGLQNTEARIENRRIWGEVPESPLPFSSVSTHSKPDTQPLSPPLPPAPAPCLTEPPRKAGQVSDSHSTEEETEGQRGAVICQK